MDLLQPTRRGWTAGGSRSAVLAGFMGKGRWWAACVASSLGRRRDLCPHTVLLIVMVGVGAGACAYVGSCLFIKAVACHGECRWRHRVLGESLARF
jgi:hypothetical protein